MGQAPDIAIIENYNRNQVNLSAFGSNGSTYKIIDGMNEDALNNYFTGARKFTLNELEVYSVKRL